MKHPLINEASTHYDNAIADLEDQLTVDEMVGACKFNIGKYFARLGKKTVKKEAHFDNLWGISDKFNISKYFARFAEILNPSDKYTIEIEKNRELLEVAQSDMNKIHTYNNYLELLYYLKNKKHDFELVSDAYKQEGISFEK